MNQMKQIWQKKYFVELNHVCFRGIKSCLFSWNLIMFVFVELNHVCFQVLYSPLLAEGATNN